MRPLDSWIQRLPDPDLPLFRDGAYGNQRFVVVGHSGSVGTSEDGLKWTTREAGFVGRIWTITFGNGRFVAFGNDSGTGNAFGFPQFPTTALVSIDGLSWQTVPIPDTGGSFAIAYGGGLFVAVGNKRILTSPSGIDWTQRYQNPSVHLSSVAFGNETFVAVGDLYIGTSRDGVQWNRSHLPEHPLNDIIFADEEFVAVEENGAILTSNNGVDWTEQSSSTSLPLRGVAFGKGQFVAFGSSEPDTPIGNIVLTSTDARDWRPMSSSPENPSFLDVAFGEEIFVGLDRNHTIATSPIA
ncbi:MAG: hypothetical protein O2960_05005 [Verrucomicrobia bacterium]|nr:hypothetical protein [Verrucomicrobiota bacterium]